MEYDIVKSPAAKHRYDLMAGERVLGSITFEKPMSYQRAVTEVNGKKWTLFYKGWNSSKIFVTDERGKTEELKPMKWWKSEAVLRMNEKPYTFGSKNWWSMSMEVRDEGAASRTSVKSCGCWWWQKKVGKAEFPHDPSEQDIQLALIAYYKLKLGEAEAAAAVVVPAIIVTTTV